MCWVYWLKVWNSRHVPFLFPNFPYNFIEMFWYYLFRFPLSLCPFIRNGLWTGSPHKCDQDTVQAFLVAVLLCFFPFNVEFSSVLWCLFLIQASQEFQTNAQHTNLFVILIIQPYVTDSTCLQWTVPPPVFPFKTIIIRFPVRPEVFCLKALEVQYTMIPFSILSVQSTHFRTIF